ncbi:serine O-acetyltransferase [Neobacillus vireti]|uniref:Serine acetyltransferase n=1 Tax=Neobacillus vireti LMG 21834 TaxID=1131730 RepID=A0AB94IQA5_9BACI|nr:serine acetyltransferase [Neobacillus vireti]ETI69192.1 serine acetyltransferase [Neobacillus vireti LMG 21834]KLT15565.1 serine acetyltransferase [Neobacillus vireti]
MNAIKLYRVGNWCYKHKIPIIPTLTKFLTFILFNSVVPYTAEIGNESKFAYGGIGVVIHARSKIGSRVIIGQNVTIGRALDPETIPEIGNNVYISAGARIIGNIKVGDNVIIGTNAVVTKDVPNNCICAGIPAKTIRTVDVDVFSLLKNIY